MVPNINLLPESKRERPKGKVLYFILGALAVLLLLFFIVQAVSLSKKITELERVESTLQSERTTLSTELEALKEQQKMGLESSVIYIENIVYDASPIIIEMKSHLTEHAYLRGYQFSEGTVSLNVDFETLADVASYLEKLQGSPYVKDVTVQQIATFDPINKGEENQKELFTTVDRYANVFEIQLDLAYIKEAKR